MDGACTEGPGPALERESRPPCGSGSPRPPAAGSGAERALSLPLQIALVGCQVRLPSGARLPASSPVLSSLFNHTPTPTLY